MTATDQSGSAQHRAARFLLEHQAVGTRRVHLRQRSCSVAAAQRGNPGSLAALAASLADHGLNIRSVQVHAVADGAVDEFLVEVASNTTCVPTLLQLVRGVYHGTGSVW